MTMNTIRVNGELEELPTGVAALTDYLAAKGIAHDAKGIAVALNGRLVQRVKWAETSISAGDALEIVQAKQGG